MDIIIIADFCGSFDENWKSYRFLYLADLLNKNNNVEIVTSDFDHAKKAFFSKPGNEYPFKVTFLHEIGYSKNICIRRFISHFIWGLNVKRYLKKRKSPDVVYAAVPTLSAPYFSGKICKRKNIRFIIDIQDLWPEAYQMVFNIPVISPLLFFPFSYIANRVYAYADSVCGVSKSYINRALYVNKNNVSGHCVYLGTDLSGFDSGYTKKPFLIKKDDDLWLGYCGSLSDSYDIPLAIDALAILKNRGVILPKFVIMGDGYKKEEFAYYARLREVDTLFTGNLPYSDMCSVLSLCDIVVNPIKKGSAASIINKHGDYAAAGIPVLNTQDSKEYRELVDEYQMGLNCSNEAPDDMADKLFFLISNADIRAQMGKNARKCAEEKFDRRRTYDELMNAVMREESHDAQTESYEIV